MEKIFFNGAENLVRLSFTFEILYEPFIMKEKASKTMLTYLNLLMKFYVFRYKMIKSDLTEGTEFSSFYELI